MSGIGVKIIGCVIFLFGCTTQSDSLSQDKIIVKKSYFESGQLKTEQEFINDTVQHGFYKRYYENGQLEIEIPYDNDIKKGLVTTYYETGEVESKVSFERGQENGQGTWYYKNGSVEEEAYFSNGFRIGEVHAYYEDNSIKRYMYYTDDGEPHYIRKYREDGSVIAEEGHGIVNIFIEKDSLKVGEKLKSEFTVISPPNTEQKFFIGVLDENYNVIERKEQPIQAEKNTVIYEREMNTLRVYKWGAVLQVIDKKTNETVEYKFTMDNLKVTE